MPNLKEIKKSKRKFTEDCTWKDGEPKNPDAASIDSDQHEVNRPWDNTLLEDAKLTLGSPLEIPTDNIIRWKFKDRPENELGDIESLAKDIEANGQIQPVIVRKLDQDKYELIVGERRWRACKALNVKVRAEIKDLDDKSAFLLQSSENMQRQDLSDYAKACSYKLAIDANIINQRDFANDIGKSQSYLRNMLSYFKIDEEIILLIGDIHKVSSRTAYEICLIQGKGDIYTTALKKVAPFIAISDLGAKRLNLEISKVINRSGDNYTRTTRTIFGEDSMPLFTIRGDNVCDKAISFSKSVREKIDFSKIEKMLKDFVEEQLLNEDKK